MAAGYLSDIYFYLRIGLAVGDGGKSAARPAVSLIQCPDLLCHAGGGSVGGNLVWYIIFYGICGFADVPAAESVEKSAAHFGVFHLSVSVYPV